MMGSIPNLVVTRYPMALVISAVWVAWSGTGGFGISAADGSRNAD